MSGFPRDDEGLRRSTNSWPAAFDPWLQGIPEVVPVGEPGRAQPLPEVEPVFGQSDQPPTVYEGLPAVCWRCGQPVARQALQCPWCAARLAGLPQVTAVAQPGERPWSLRALVSVLVGYVVILGAVIGCAAIVFLKAKELGLPLGIRLPERLDDLRKLRDLELQYAIIASVVMALLVLATWVAAGRIRPLPRPSPTNRLAAWVLGPVLVLPALFLINIGYSLLLQQLVPKEQLELQRRLGRELASVPVYWVLLTVQPAIFEELFFRYLALGAMYDALRGGGRQLAMHLSVFLTGVMFGAAHLGQALAIPYLILVGMALGYLRLASGSLALPMLLHFLHNTAVLVLQRL